MLPQLWQQSLLHHTVCQCRGVAVNNASIQGCLYSEAIATLPSRNHYTAAVAVCMKKLQVQNKQCGFRTLSIQLRILLLSVMTSDEVLAIL